MSITLRAEPDDAGRRLDRILRKALPDLPLSALFRCFRRGQILVNGKPAMPPDRIAAGSAITIEGIMDLAPGGGPERPAGKRPSPPLPPVLFEGSGLLALNKYPGIAAHGPGGLDSLVRSYLAGRLPPSLSFRPGPLHRLDKPSGGILVFSTSLEGARSFSALMREGGIKKYYLALAEGVLPETEVWRDELVRDRDEKKTFTAEPGPGAEGAKTALTRIRALAGNSAYTLILAEIRTGRTHQIRAQAAARGHPLAGDRKYGGGKESGPFLLHAWQMEFLEPETFPAGPLPRLITAPPSGTFRRRIEDLFGSKIAGQIFRRDARTEIRGRDLLSAGFSKTGGMA